MCSTELKLHHNSLIHYNTLTYTCIGWGWYSQTYSNHTEWFSWHVIRSVADEGQYCHIETVPIIIYIMWIASRCALSPTRQAEIEVQWWHLCHYKINIHAVTHTVHPTSSHPPIVAMLAIHWKKIKFRYDVQNFIKEAIMLESIDYHWTLLDVAELHVFSKSWISS